MLSSDSARTAARYTWPSSVHLPSQNLTQKFRAKKANLHREAFVEGNTKTKGPSPSLIHISRQEPFGRLSTVYSWKLNLIRAWELYGQLPDVAELEGHTSSRIHKNGLTNIETHNRQTPQHKRIWKAVIKHRPQPALVCIANHARQRPFLQPFRYR